MRVDKTKVILLIVVLALFGLTLYNLGSSFALFESNEPLEIIKETAKWKIVINNSDITPENSSFLVNNVQIVDNGHTALGKLSPDSSAYFDITIVPTETEVSIRYDITFDFTELNECFEIDSIIETTSGNLIQTDAYTYSNVISVADILDGEINNIRVTVNWNNNEDYNDIDSMLGRDINSKISIPVSVKVSQYLGEELEEYE